MTKRNKQQQQQQQPQKIDNAQDVEFTQELGQQQQNEKQSFKHQTNNQR